MSITNPFGDIFHLIPAQKHVIQTHNLSRKKLFVDTVSGKRCGELVLTRGERVVLTTSISTLIIYLLE
jgi:hypothetical protein